MMRGKAAFAPANVQQPLERIHAAALLVLAEHGVLARLIAVAASLKRTRQNWIDAM
ncbi:MAG: hypothetical protein M3466_07470 [Gemmatimonadota bacterium]|nr:hypothetical protein [Gemmatimonadota bacterium]